MQRVPSIHFTVRSAEWIEDGAALCAIRHEVFVEEQGVPAEMEYDGHDAASIHAVAEDVAGRAIGCGRLLPDGHIGRMAVRREWRGKGVGAVLLRHLVAVAKASGHLRVELNAQVHALPFYAREGFAPIGDVFEEAGIAHQAMAREVR